MFAQSFQEHKLSLISNYFFRKLLKQIGSKKGLFRTSIDGESWSPFPILSSQAVMAHWSQITFHTFQGINSHLQTILFTEKFYSDSRVLKYIWSTRFCFLIYFLGYLLNVLKLIREHLRIFILRKGYCHL